MSDDPWDVDLDFEPAEGFRVTTDEQADGQLRRMARTKREIERIEANARREIERITADKNAAVKTLNDRVEVCKLRLVDYRRQLELADPGLPKTYKLNYGTITRRAGSTSVSVTDEDEFVCWALEADPSLLSVSPSKSAIRALTTATSLDVLKATAAKSETGASTRLVSEDGEEVPGVELSVGPDRYDAFAP